MSIELFNFEPRGSVVYLRAARLSRVSVDPRVLGITGGPLTLFTEPPPPSMSVEIMSLSKSPSLPSFPTPEHYESPPLSPSSASSNDSPFVDSPPSSLYDEDTLDECPAHEEFSSPPPILLSLPFFDIEPSLEELKARLSDQYLAFGIPIPDE